MSASNMDKRVTIQAPPSGRNEMNEPAGEWTNVVTDGDGMVWAAVNDLTGREYAAAGGTQNVVTTKIEIYYRPGITDKMRVLHGADVYTIEAALGQDKRMLLLMCSRGKPHG